MATRDGFDVAQKLLGKAVDPVLDYASADPNVGVLNDWNTLMAITLGSLDYYHKVAFSLAQMYQHTHPMFLDEEDAVTVGFINGDVTDAGRDAELFDSTTFNIDWANTPAGTGDYPAWDGWPVDNDALPGYPEASSTRVIVHMKGMWVRITASVGGVTAASTFEVDVPRAVSESTFGSPDYEDVRVYYTTENTTTGLPVGGLMTEVARTISDDTITIEVPVYLGWGAPSLYYIICWDSPDGYADDVAPTTIVASDASSLLTIEEGEPREYFDESRYDLVHFSNDRNHILKHVNSTRFDLVDGSAKFADETNPKFYRLPSLEGSLDSSSGAIPFIGSIWGYGYSFDKGDDNPSSRHDVFGAILCYRAAAGEDVDMQVLSGPTTPPEFHPNDWKDFGYYPPIPDEYTVLAKAIVKQAQSNHDSALRPKSYIEYLDIMPSYGREHISEQSFVRDMTTTLLENILLPHDIQGLAGETLFPILKMTPITTDLTSGFYSNAARVLDVRSASLLNQYWKVPVDHPATTRTISAVESMHELMSEDPYGYPGQLLFERGIREITADYLGHQLSTILSTFDADSGNATFGTYIFEHPTTKIYEAASLEIVFGGANACQEFGATERTEKDYTVRLKLRSETADSITKDVFVTAGKYFVTDDEAAELLSAGTGRDPYLWPTRLQENRDWVLHGRAALTPDPRAGETREIVMKQFDPDDPDLLTETEFLAAQEEIYADELNSGDPVRVSRAQALIDAAVDRQDLIGYDTIDTRTVADDMVGIDDMNVGVTLYTTAATLKWQSSSRFWGGGHPTVDIYDEDTGQLKVRYGYEVNDAWQFQSFTQSEVEADRSTYIEEHPESSFILRQQIDDDGAVNGEFRLDGTRVMLGTTFIADFTDVSGKIYSVNLKLRAGGIPVVNMLATIDTVGSTSAPSAILQVSAPTSYELLSEDFEWIEFTFSKPADLSAGERYALVLTVENPLDDEIPLSATNYIDWAYADQNVYSYGATGTTSTLSEDEPSSSAALTLADGTNFSTSSFYVTVAGDLHLVTSRSGNVLTLSTPTTTAYSEDDRVYEVSLASQLLDNPLFITKSITGVTKNRLDTSLSLNVDHSLSKGLVGSWLFSEGSGSTTDNNANFGRYTGTISGATWVPGKNGWSLSFNGADANVTVGDLVELNATTSFMISFWMNQRVIDVADTIFTKATDADNHLEIRTTAGGNFEVGLDDGADAIGYWDYSDDISALTWYHISIVYDGGGAANADRLKIFVDGRQISLSFTGTIPTATNDLAGVDATIGAASGSFDGLIEDFKIYDEAMSDANVKWLEDNTLAMYESSVSPKIPFFSSSSSAADFSQRWTYVEGSDQNYSWVNPSTNPEYDATYQLLQEQDVVGAVVEVQYQEWTGADLEITEGGSDAFYIAASDDEYIADNTNAPFVGWLDGLDPVAGFNVPNSYDFPPVNVSRARGQNRTDGYMCWKSKRYTLPTELSIFPLAQKVGTSVVYIPTVKDMYVTAICRRWDGTREAVNKLVPAGTATPLSLASETEEITLRDAYVSVKSPRLSGGKPAVSAVIDSDHPLANGLIGAWLMNEGTGGIIADHTNGENVATATSEPAWTLSPNGLAMEFTVGDPDYLSCSSVLPVTSELTVVSYCLVNNSAANRLLLDSRDADNDGFVLFVDSSDQLSLYWNEYDYTSGSAITQGEWVQFACTHKPGESLLYENGGLLSGSASGTGGAANVALTSPPTIGTQSFSTPAESWDGSIGLVYVWNRSLSAEEIGWLYQTPYEMFSDGSRRPIFYSQTATINTSEYVGVDMLWVDDTAFSEAPFYGYGPAEAFTIRSI